MVGKTVYSVSKDKHSGSVLGIFTVTALRNYLTFTDYMSLKQVDS